MARGPAYGANTGQWQTAQGRGRARGTGRIYRRYVVCDSPTCTWWDYADNLSNVSHTCRCGRPLGCKGGPAAGDPAKPPADAGKADQLTFAEVVKKAAEGALALPADAPKEVKDYFESASKEQDAKEKSEDPQANNRALTVELRKQAKLRKQAMAGVDQVIRLKKQLAEAEQQRDAKMDEFSACKDKVAKFMELASAERQPAAKPNFPVVQALGAVDKEGIPDELAAKLDIMVAEFKKLMGEVEATRIRPDKRLADDDDDMDMEPATKKQVATGADGAPQPVRPAPAGGAQGSQPGATSQAAGHADPDKKDSADDPEAAFKALEMAADTRRRRREKSAAADAQPAAAAKAKGDGKGS